MPALLLVSVAWVVSIAVKDDSDKGRSSGSSSQQGSQGTRNGSSSYSSGHQSGQGQGSSYSAGGAGGADGSWWQQRFGKTKQKQAIPKGASGKPCQTPALADAHSVHAFSWQIKLYMFKALAPGYAQPLPCLTHHGPLQPLLCADLSGSPASGEVLRVLQSKDLFDVLELPRSCDDEDVRRAKRTKSLATHPDKLGGAPGAKEAFQRVTEVGMSLGSVQIAGGSWFATIRLH